MTTLTPTPKQQFLDANGNPLSGGKVYAYAAGTTTPLVTYTDESGTTPNTNPVILDSRGEAGIWLGVASYKLKLTTATDVEIWTVDNIVSASVQALADLSESGGSALVGFLQSGTGAVATTVQAKLREMVSVKDFGAVGDDSDETTKLANALAAATGNTLWFEPGKIYRATASLVVPANTTLELNGSTIKFVTTGETRNLDLRSGTVVCNGTIENAGSAFSSSGDFQCPIIIGDYGVGTGYNNICLKNLIVKTARPGGNGITVTGDSYDISIENITFPDSAYMMIAVLLHWGGANAPASGTTHPHNISIKNLKIGAMTYATASDAGQVLVSACYNVSIENVDIKDAHNAGLYIYSGDYGFYYAPASVVGFANTGITVKNFAVWTSDKYGCVIRGDAASAPGAPIYKIPAIIENLSILAATDNGINLQYAQDTKFIGCFVANTANGILTDTANCQRIRIQGGTFRNNTVDGIVLKNNAIDCVVDGAHAYANGYAGMETVTTNTRVINCTFGSATEAIQGFGIRVGPSSVGDILENNICLGATNVAFSLANGTSYGTVSSFLNNVGPSGATGTGGLLQIPFAQMGAGSTAKKLLSGAAIPAAGTWAVGDIILNTAPAASGFIGWVCTTAGTPGTWKTFGAISA